MPVASAVIVIRADGTAAPEGSATTPNKLEVITCAEHTAATASSAAESEYLFLRQALQRCYLMRAAAAIVPLSPGISIG